MNNWEQDESTKNLQEKAKFMHVFFALQFLFCFLQLFCIALYLLGNMFYNYAYRILIIWFNILQDPTAT